jgi:uncharacterized membrane protein
MLSITDHNYGITALHNYGFTVRLPPKKLENQSLNPLKIETAHRGGHTNPYSVAKLNKGPSGTLMLIVDPYYRVSKKSLDSMHALLYFSMLAVFLGTISGIIAHEPIEEKLLQIPIFSFHQFFGLFLSVLFLLVGLVRYFLARKETRLLRDLYTSLLTIGVLLLFLQGRWGGSIVYDYLLKGKI